MMRHDSRLARSAARLAALLTVSLGLIACSSSLPDHWDRSMETEGPRRSGDQLVYLNQTLEQIHRLEPTRSSGSLKLKTTRAPTGEDPTALEFSPDGERLFVLNAGDRTLGVYDTTSSKLTRQTVQLESAYDRITVSPDGQFVLLTFSEDPGDSCVVCNVNEVGVVDLRDGVPDSAQFVSLGKRATDLVFAEPFEVEGETQRLVAALSPSLVTLLDLRAVADGEDDARREIQLTVSEAEAVRNPTGATFDIHPDDDTPAAAHLYVRALESRDVTQISLTPSQQSRTFDISINQLAAGRGPSAMTVLEMPDGGKRLMTLDRSRSAFALIDVQSGESDTFDLPTGSAPTDMLTYRIGGGDSGEGGETRVLAYSTRSEIVAIVRPETIAVSEQNPTLGRSVEAVRLEGAPNSIRLQSREGRVRAIAALSGGDSAVLKLGADDNEATPIQSPPLADLFFGAEAAWGVFDDRENLARYDLETGHGTPYELPETGQRVFLDAEESLLTIQHETTAGTFTVLDLKTLEPDAEPKSARLFEGVFLEKLLQQRSSNSSNEG
jgi:dipeptidyl aminopeptidase/acylaminoacyl peptidase